MKIRSIVKKILSSALIAGMLSTGGCKTVTATAKPLEAPLRAELTVPMEYGNSYFKARLPGGEYEHYEYAGYDGTKYCMETVRMNDDNLDIMLIDGVNGLCDNLVDAYVAEGKPITNGKRVFFCKESDKLSAICERLSISFGMFKEDNFIDLVKREWENYRHTCKGQCRIGLILPLNLQSIEFNNHVIP